MTTAQRLKLWRDTSDPAALVALFESPIPSELFAENLPPIWRLALALARADAGDVLAATNLLHGLCIDYDHFRSVPRGPFTLGMWALAAELADALQDKDLGSVLVGLLRDHPERGVVLGWPALYLGATERYLGLAQRAAGDLDGALSSFERAVTVNQEMRTIPAELYSRYDLSRTALEITPDDSTGAAEGLRYVLRRGEELGMAPLVSRARALAQNLPSSP